MLQTRLVRIALAVCLGGTVVPAAAQTADPFAGKATVPAPGGIKPLAFPTTIAPVSKPANSAKSAAEQVAREIEVKGYKLVNIPRPPVLDKTLRIAALKADKTKTDKDKAEKARPDLAKIDHTKTDHTKADKTNANDKKTVQTPEKVPAQQARAGEVVPGIPAVKPPEPKATGIFAMFTQGNPDAGSSAPADGAVVRPPASAAAFARVDGPTTKVASLRAMPTSLKTRPFFGTKDDDLEDEEKPTIGGLRKQISAVQTDCLQPQLLAMVKQASDHFGREAVITSGYRGHGRRGSYHRRCAAVDFQIPGVSSSQLVSFLRNMPGAGGVGTYCHTKSVHLDTGEPRNWHHCGSRSFFALRTPVYK